MTACKRCGLDIETGECECDEALDPDNPYDWVADQEVPEDG
jgi:hypothetical protein